MLSEGIIHSPLHFFLNSSNDSLSFTVGFNWNVAIATSIATIAMIAIITSRAPKYAWHQMGIDHCSVRDFAGD